jgi:hypothetical protein
MHDEKLYRLVFVGGFGAYFLWSLLSLISVIPILGAVIQLGFIKWLTRSVMLVPLELDPTGVKMFMKTQVDRQRALTESRR